MLEHGDPLDPHPEGEALDPVGVIAVVTDMLEHVGIHHPRAEDLDPRRALAQRAALPVGGHPLLAVEAGDVDLGARLSEREEVRAHPDLALVAEDRAREGEQRALEIGERDVVVDGETFELVELGGVGGVRVGPVYAAGHDGVERWRLELHRPDLNRRGVDAQQRRLGIENVSHRLDVERVAQQPRGMHRREVQRVEVVVDGLDLGSFGDVEAQAQEHIFDLPPGLGDQVQATDLRLRVRGQRDVDPILYQAGIELGRCQRGDLGVDRGLDCLPGLIGGLPGGGALVGCQLRDSAQQVGQLGLAPEIADAHLLELRGAARRRDRGHCLLLQLGDPLGHQRAILVAS